MIAVPKGEAFEMADRRLQALDIVAQLKGGADFAELARARSKDSQAANGGDWGWLIPKDDLNASLAEAIDKVPAGETGGARLGGWFTSLVDAREFAKL